MSPRVSILIPTARQAERLRSCLASLAADRCQTPREILVLLNDASDEVRRVARAIPGITVLESAVNLGVAGGYNRLRCVAHGELLALLHDDTELHPGWLDRLCATLDAHPEAGIVGGLVLHPDGSLRSNGALLARDGRTMLRRGSRPPDPATLTEVEPVDYVAGSFLLVRAAAFDRAGGCDERLYPAYSVDVALALAVRATSGQVTLCDPLARQTHFEGTSGSALRQLLIARHARQVGRRYAALLAEHGPFGVSPEAVAAAELRVRRQAARLAEARCWEGLAPVPFEVDVAAQQRRAVAAEAQLRRVWARHQRWAPLRRPLAAAAALAARLGRRLRRAASGRRAG